MWVSEYIPLKKNEIELWKIVVDKVYLYHRLSKIPGAKIQNSPILQKYKLGKL